MQEKAMSSPHRSQPVQQPATAASATAGTMKDLVIDQPLATDGQSAAGAASTQHAQASIHLIRVADAEMRKRAFHILLATQESWVRLPGNVMGVSTRQVEALTREHLPFDWISKAPCNA
jgi:hypothetical protein